MTDIRINTEEVTQAGVQFGTKHDELMALISQADSLMTKLQGVWKGARATKTFSEWQTLKSTLTKAAPSLTSASTLLKNAATDFSAADSA